jgi:hypothetical protein
MHTRGKRLPISNSRNNSVIIRGYSALDWVSDRDLCESPVAPTTIAIMSAVRYYPGLSKKEHLYHRFIPGPLLTRHNLACVVPSYGFTPL